MKNELKKQYEKYQAKFIELLEKAQPLNDYYSLKIHDAYYDTYTELNEKYFDSFCNAYFKEFRNEISYELGADFDDFADYIGRTSSFQVSCLNYDNFTDAIRYYEKDKDLQLENEFYNLDFHAFDLLDSENDLTEKDIAYFCDSVEAILTDFENDINESLKFIGILMEYIENAKAYYHDFIWLNE